MATIKSNIEDMLTEILIRIRWMLDELWQTFWNMSIWMRPHSILSLFYTLLTPSLMYLYLEFDGNFGLAQLETNTNVSWVFWIAIFSLTAWIVANSSKNYVYVLSFAPIGIYIVNLGVSINEVSVLGILPIVYLVGFVMMGISSIRLMFSNRELARQVIALEHKIDDANEAYNTLADETLTIRDKYLTIKRKIESPQTDEAQVDESQGA